MATPQEINAKLRELFPDADGATIDKMYRALESSLSRLLPVEADLGTDEGMEERVARILNRAIRILDSALTGEEITDPIAQGVIAAVRELDPEAKRTPRQIAADRLFAELARIGFLDPNLAPSDAFKKYLSDILDSQLSRMADLGLPEGQFEGLARQDIPERFQSQSNFEQGQGARRDMRREMNRVAAEAGISPDTDAFKAIQEDISKALDDEMDAGEFLSPELVSKHIRQGFNNGIDPRSEKFQPVLGTEAMRKFAKSLALGQPGSMLVQQESLRDTLLMQKSLRKLSDEEGIQLVNLQERFGEAPAQRDLTSAEWDIFSATGIDPRIAEDAARTRRIQRLQVADIPRGEAGIPTRRAPVTRTGIIRGLEARGMTPTEPVIAAILENARTGNLSSLDILNFGQPQRTETRINPVTGEPEEVAATSEDPTVVGQNVRAALGQVPSALSAFSETLSQREREVFTSNVPQLRREWENKARSVVEQTGRSFRLLPTGASTAMTTVNGRQQSALSSFGTFLEQKRAAGTFRPAQRALPNVRFR
jgi:hypothetical protein